MLYQSMYSIEENMRITLSQDSIEVEAAKHFNKDRRQSSFCLAKVIFARRNHVYNSTVFSSSKKSNQERLLYFLSQLAPAPPDLIEGSYKLIQVK